MNRRISIAGVAASVLLTAATLALFGWWLPQGSADRTGPVAGTPHGSAAQLAPAVAEALRPAGSGTTGLNGIFGERLVDTDADSLPDTLEIDVGVDAGYSFEFGVSGTLADNSGRELADAEATALLPIGSGVITLRFRGADLQRGGANGPYVLKRVALNTTTAMVDNAQDAYTTQAYSLSAFEPLAVRLTGAYADNTVDSDGDGRYEKLVLSAGVVVTEAGSYEVSGVLGDGTGNLIYQGRTNVTLGTSNTTVTLEVPAAAIRASHANGPYVVMSFTVQRDGLPESGVAKDAHTTQAYTVGSFGPVGGVTATIVGDEAVDVQAGLSPPPGGVEYEYLRVHLIAGGVVPTPGDRLEAEVQLYASDGTQVAEWQRSFPVNQLPTVPGGRAIDVDVPGGFLRQHGLDGPYRVGVTLRNQVGQVLDVENAVYETKAYEADNFVLPLIQIQGNTQIVVTDASQNGLYDGLEFRVTVVAGQSGAITGQGRVVSADGTTIAKVETGLSQLDAQSAAAAGESLVLTLRVPGTAIRTSGRNGPYTLKDLFLYHKNDPRQYVLLNSAGTSSAYSYLQFE
jgi:hypothetical protein